MLSQIQVFQRIWSGRITTEYKAWELLSIVDQIHLWGVTEFRNFVIQHLKAWHEFGKECYARDVDFMNIMPQAGKKVANGKVNFSLPSFPLPRWTEHFTTEARRNFKHRALGHLYEAFLTYWGAHAHFRFPDILDCALEGCSPGRRLATPEEAIAHLRDVHGSDVEDLASLSRHWGRQEWAEPPTELTSNSNSSSTTSSSVVNRRRRRPKSTGSELRRSKRRKQ